MAQFDIHTRLLGVPALNPQTIASDTTTAGAIIDMQGYEALEFFIQSGTITTGVFTPLLEESDSSTMAGSNVVSTDYTLGLIADATFTVAAADDNAVKRIGYVGKKRYVRLSMVTTSTGNGAIGAVAVKGHLKSAEIDATT
jgi:hypothetical protein